MKGSYEKEQGAIDYKSLSSLTIAAHELKSPLSLLRQLALSLEADDLSEHERRAIASHMKLVSERALRLTTNLTKAQRLEDGLFTLEPINPQQLCEEVVYELSPLYRACGRELIVTPRQRSLLAIANRDLLRRILLNFADNALYYADDASPVELSVSSRHHGETIRLGIRDYGPALSIDTWRSLRGRALRPEPLHARPGGSGLGLAIARQFAEAMNGSVGATRHRDGATFHVDIHASRQMSLL
ncbi:MAG: putative Histidine kinase [Candidatus Saccharibacteria bacterium]|nr:putative Histidine kinase [Candidatus Saccharibacteria bacterium]